MTPSAHDTVPGSLREARSQRGDHVGAALDTNYTPVETTIDKQLGQVEVRRQHIDRIMFGLHSEFRKFWKYGNPYLAVSANSLSALSLSQGKSGVML